MLRKIAEAAAWLDKRGLHAEADTMTEVLCRYASQAVFESDPDETEEDDVDPYAASFAHDITDFDLNNPEHMAVLRGFNPELADAVETYVPQRAKPSNPMSFGARTLKLRPGHGTDRAGFTKRIQEFFMSPEQIQQNKEAFENKLQSLTRNRKMRQTLDLDYASTSGSPLAGRVMVHDPRLEEVVRTLPKYQDNSNAVMFDRDMLKAIFDPATDVESLDPEIQRLVMRAREGRPSLDEDITEPTPYSLAEQLDFAAKQLRPERALMLQRYRRPKDPATGKPIPNFYLQLPKGK